MAEEEHIYKNIEEMNSYNPPALKPRAYKAREPQASAQVDDGNVVYADLDLGESSGPALPVKKGQESAYGPVGGSSPYGPIGGSSPYGPIKGGTNLSEADIVYSEVIAPETKAPKLPPKKGQVADVTKNMGKMELMNKHVLQCTGKTTGANPKPIIISVELDPPPVTIVIYDAKGVKTHIFPVVTLRAYGQKEGRLRLDAGSRCPTGEGCFRFEVHGDIDVASRVRSIRKGEYKPQTRAEPVERQSYVNIEDNPQIGSDYRQMGTDYRDL
eukprot:m.16214 g.16214  ORF g.16214 m.16214 type:complete len:270 (+) comp5621_c0_seq1:50-859(+)